MTLNLIQQLREQTGAGIMDCKKALSETGNDLEKALAYLHKKGITKAATKAERTANQGLIESYIHTNGTIGVLVELNCETDFVARTDEFKTLAHDLALHIAASAPLVVSREKLDPAIINQQKKDFQQQLQAEGKPAAMLEKIIEGKLEKYYAQVCLLEQPFVKDPEKTIQEIITAAVAKIGENIQIKRFTRFVLGE